MFVVYDFMDGEVLLYFLLFLIQSENLDINVLFQLFFTSGITNKKISFHLGAGLITYQKENLVNYQYKKEN